MNGYILAVLILLCIIVARIYNLEPAIQKFVNVIFDIPEFRHANGPTALYILGVRCIYLITIVAIIKLLIMGGKNKDE